MKKSWYDYFSACHFFSSRMIRIMFNLSRFISDYRQVCLMFFSVYLFVWTFKLT